MRKYVVRVPVDGGRWYDLCTCCTVDATLSVVGALVASGTAGVHTVQVECVDADPPGAWPVTQTVPTV